MKFRSKDLLVTGGAGFIGSNFINYLLKKYDSLKIYNLDLLTYAGNLENTNLFKDNPNYFFIKGDISNEGLVQSLFDEYEIDGVINFAAESHVDNSIVNPEVFIKTNINGVFNLLNISYKNWMSSNFKLKNKFKHSRFHQISTDEVYGSIIDGSFSEKSQYRPNSPYSASKASADMLVRSFNKTFGLNTTISVCSNNYGKNQNKEKFIPTIINSLINGKSIPVYGDGLNVRDWINVKDHCEAIEKVFNNSSSGETYNVGANNEISNLELIDKIYFDLKKKFKIEKKIKFIDDRFGHDRRYSLSTSKIFNDLNWEAKYKMEIDEIL
tara:strand:- start:33482 stop:34456 length:975 start_codon:yes stop_codon:yes gene_type:complete